MFKRTVKAFIVSLVLLFSTVNVFALEEYVAEIYKEIDSCFTSKDEEKLYAVLSRNNKDKYYYLIENYTQKKIRRLIVNNEYVFAMEATLAVIENNLDNEEAVEMYSVISDAYEIQLKHEAEVAHQKELEAARLQLAKEKQRGNVEKEYNSAKKATGDGSVYVSGKESKLSSYSWKAKFGAADALFLLEKTGNLKTLHYGVSLDFNYIYTLENKIKVGADVFAGVQFLGMAEEKDLVPFFIDGEAAIKFCNPNLLKNLFIRTGFNVMLAGESNKAVNTEGVEKKFYSPFVGLKFEQISIGPVRLDIGADWLAGHLFTDNITMAAGASMNVEIPFAELEKVKLNLNIGAKDKIFLKKDNGLENRASLILAIGVENVIR